MDGERDEVEQVTAQQFFSAWRASCEELASDLFGAWFHGREFSKIALRADDSAFMRTAKHLRFHAHREYYWTDGVLFRDVDRVPDSPAGETWLRRIRVTFEHENIFGKRLFEEIGHLLLIDAELRVLVTYPNLDSKRDLVFAELHELVAETHRASIIATSGSLLIICGYRDEVAAHVRWEGFVYRSDGWKHEF